MRAAYTSPTLRQHHRPSVTVFDHVRVFIVTLVFAAAVTFLLGSALLGRY